MVKQTKCQKVKKVVTAKAKSLKKETKRTNKKNLTFFEKVKKFFGL